MQKTQKINGFAFAVTKSCEVTLAECWNSAAVLAARFTLAGAKDGMELAVREDGKEEGVTEKPVATYNYFCR